MTMKRFSKAAVLDALDKRSAAIANAQQFDRSNGTSQLGALLNSDGEDILARAVEYGRMRAFEQFAEAICEGFDFWVQRKANRPRSSPVEQRVWPYNNR